MFGIRVHEIPRDVSEKKIWIHFKKAENGGGKIKKVYFPLLNNDAVIIYEDRSVVDTVIRTSHVLESKTLVLYRLPEHVIFSKVSARLDAEASVLVQATLTLQDEMVFGEGIRLVLEDDQTYSLHGNWFQLEWAWHYIDCFMQQKKYKQSPKMSGIRVKNIPKDVTEKRIRIQLMKAENGGGKIKKTYFPLSNNDAVILYEDKSVVDTVIRGSHVLQSTALVLFRLPEHDIFSKVSARLDAEASVLVQANLTLQDEMMFGEGIQLVLEDDQTYSLHGNLFQLEWAWHYIDCFMQQQQYEEFSKMSGIRVRNIPKEVTEKSIRIQFGKPENGGGKIKKIYYPLFDNDAVIIYEDKSVVDTVIRTSRVLQSTTLVLNRLPEHMIFSNVSARLDAKVSVLLQATQTLQDEIIFGEGIQLVLEDDQTYSLHGNWFQLEWAWHYIECFMQQQEIIRQAISSHTQQPAGTPKKVKKTERSRKGRDHSYGFKSLSNDTERQGDFKADRYVSQSRTGEGRSEVRAPSNYGAYVYPLQSRLPEFRPKLVDNNVHSSGSRTRNITIAAEAAANHSQSGSLATSDEVSGRRPAAVWD